MICKPYKVSFSVSSHSSSGGGGNIAASLGFINRSIYLAKVNKTLTYRIIIFPRSKRKRLRVEVRVYVETAHTYKSQHWGSRSIRIRSSRSYDHLY